MTQKGPGAGVESAARYFWKPFCLKVHSNLFVLLAWVNAKACANVHRQHMNFTKLLYVVQLLTNAFIFLHQFVVEVQAI